LHIKGDVKYGAKRTNDEAGIHLHARNIEFLHPVKKDKISVSAQPPHNQVWDNFFNLW
jgi:23S rRNA pseudouridine1911/1915/1917 synthase